MIKIQEFEFFNFKSAIRGMRNPHDSWDKSDTIMCDEMPCLDCPMVDNCNSMGDPSSYPIIGESDLALMRKLYKAGPEHAKFMRQIFCSFDVTAPLYWWKEMDTYKIGTTSNSCSTMHTIHKRDLDVDDFSHEHLSPMAMENLKQTINTINFYRNLFVNDADEKGNKEHWWQIIQLLPSSYNQRRTLTMSYANLSNIVKQRTGHKLDEWRRFVENILIRVPYLRQIMGNESFAPDLG